MGRPVGGLGSDHSPFIQPWETRRRPGPGSQALGPFRQLSGAGLCPLLSHSNYVRQCPWVRTPNVLAVFKRLQTPQSRHLVCRLAVQCSPSYPSRSASSPCPCSTVLCLQKGRCTGLNTPTQPEPAPLPSHLEGLSLLPKQTGSLPLAFPTHRMVLLLAQATRSSWAGAHVTA